MRAYERTHLHQTAAMVTERQNLTAVVFRKKNENWKKNWKEGIDKEIKINEGIWIKKNPNARRRSSTTYMPAKVTDASQNMYK